MNIWQDTLPCGTPQTNLSIAQGELVALGVTVSNDTGPVDLTGAALVLTVGCSPALVLTLASGITLPNATGGQVQFNIPSATTRTLPLGTYHYDAWMNSSLQILSGQFTVRAAVTHL